MLSESEKFAKKREKLREKGKNWEKEGKDREKREKSGRKGKNQEGSFTLPFLTEWAGYATDIKLDIKAIIVRVRIHLKILYSNFLFMRLRLVYDFTL